MLLIWAGLAQAQVVPAEQISQDLPIDVERFRPAVDAYGYAITDSSTTLRNLQLGVGLWANYSQDAVVLVWQGERLIGPGPTFADGVLDQRSVMNFQVGFGLADRFSLNLDAPVVVWQQGFEPSADTSPSIYADLVGAGIGDLRITPKVVLADIHQGYPIGVALLVRGSVPSGSTRSFLGEGSPTIEPILAVEAADGSIHDREYLVRGAINAGGLFKEPDVFRDVEVGPAFVWRAALAAHPLPPLEVGVDAGGLAGGADAANLPVEILPWLKLLPLPIFSFNAGLGFGVNPGLGSPDFRAFGGFTLHPSFDPLSLDRDRDGVPNRFDLCINVPEDIDGFEDDDGCPDDDNDKDGRLDSVDRCPNDPEDIDGFQDADGCPDLDNDQDGIVDLLDACPDVAETVNGFQDQDGCPDEDVDTDGDGFKDFRDPCPEKPEDFDNWQDDDGCPEVDNDADGLPDVVDACPNEPEVFNSYLDDDGCPDDAPSRVIVEKEQLRILDKIFFEYGKAVIQRQSYPLLDEIAAVIRAHPEISRIRVEGHTDSDGADAVNLKLSQKRAEAVVAYLVGAGIEASRLEPLGYGETEPIDTNMTSEGRANNRRVEFQILERN